jgi:hypothetical protein
VGHQEGAGEVDVDHLPPLLGSHLLEADDGKVASAVDQDVKVARGVAHQLCDGLDVGLGGDVGRRGDDLRVARPPGPPGVENDLAGVGGDDGVAVGDESVD